MNEATYYFLWGSGIGLFIGLQLGFYLGRIFAAWASSRSEYAKMKAKYDEKAERVSKWIEEGRNHGV